jgi:hypothetical protein
MAFHGKHTKAMLEKMSRDRKGWWRDPEYRAKVIASRKATQRTREDHHLWKGGKHKSPEGYVIVRVSTDKHTKYEREHRMVMEKHLGRKLLRTEEVHHRNGIKDDNRIANLEVVPHMDHFGKVQCPNCLLKFKVK